MQIIIVNAQTTVTQKYRNSYSDWNSLTNLITSTTMQEALGIQTPKDLQFLPACHDDSVNLSHV